MTLRAGTIAALTVICACAARPTTQTPPRHVQNWLYACADAKQNCHEGQNVGILASWTAAHVDWNEVYYRDRYDSTASELAAAGASHIVIYTDPNISPYCPIPAGYGLDSPDFPENGANCTGQVALELHAENGSYAHAYEHQANGNRLIDHADGLYSGQAQEPFYIGDPDVRAAFHAVTVQNRFATDVFEDDAGGSYNCVYDDNDSCSAGSSFGFAHYGSPGCDYTGGYWCYKYRETAYEWDRATNPQQAYARDAIALSEASAHPVIGNNGVGTDVYDLEWLNSPHVEGAMAEGAWTQVSDTSKWVTEADAILTYHSLRKFVVEYSSDEGRLFFQIASHWIVYDPTYSIEALAEVNPATRTAGGSDTTFPEESLVPAEPRIETPTSNNVTVLEVSPGVFVREYAVCYQSGLPIGYCAAIVNTNGSSEPITGLTQRYGHMLIHNTSATWAAGGAPEWSTSVPSTVGPNTGLILSG